MIFSQVNLSRDEDVSLIIRYNTKKLVFIMLKYKNRMSHGRYGWIVTTTITIEYYRTPINYTRIEKTLNYKITQVLCLFIKIYQHI